MLNGNENRKQSTLHDGGHTHATPEQRLACSNLHTSHQTVNRVRVLSALARASWRRSTVAAGATAATPSSRCREGPSSRTSRSSRCK